MLLPLLFCYFHQAHNMTPPTSTFMIPGSTFSTYIHNHNITLHHLCYLLLAFPHLKTHESTFFPFLPSLYDRYSTFSTSSHPHLTFHLPPFVTALHHTEQFHPLTHLTLPIHLTHPHLAHRPPSCSHLPLPPLPPGRRCAY